jgi:hypothetical protein
MFGAILLVMVFLALAAVKTSALTLISQGYLTKDKTSVGSIISLHKDSSDLVDITTIDNASNILGVVIEGGNSQLTLTAGSANQVQVVTNGVTPVLVSDINGKISSGDPITASPIAGVGMKATQNSKVIGVSQGDFPNSTASKQQYKDKSGQQKDVILGQVPVLVSVTYYYKQPDKTVIPSAFQNIANSLAGKKVDALPIIISMGIFIVTLIVVVSIIYAMIKSSIISVGRNPMAQSAVYRNVLQLSALVVAILAVAVVAIYFVLAKF